jgi:hypothetical protein
MIFVREEYCSISVVLMRFVTFSSLLRILRALSWRAHNNGVLLHVGKKCLVNIASFLVEYWSYGHFELKILFMLFLLCKVPRTGNVNWLGLLIFPLILWLFPDNFTWLGEGKTPWIICIRATQVAAVSWHFKAFVILSILCLVVREYTSFPEH